MPAPCLSRRLKYSSSVRQSTVRLNRRLKSSCSFRIRSLTGAMDSPSPVISVVTPIMTLLIARGSISTYCSDCPSMSMKPGATICPRASISRLACAPLRFPIRAMRSSLMAMSALKTGLPVPSITRPLRMIRSYAAGAASFTLGATAKGRTMAPKHNAATSNLIDWTSAEYRKSAALIIIANH